MCTNPVVIAYAKILILKQVTTFPKDRQPLIQVVIAYAKILILKQVTTGLSSRSSASSCYCLCKDTNSQASHNSYPMRWSRYAVVIAYAKILILIESSKSKTFISRFACIIWLILVSIHHLFEKETHSSDTSCSAELRE